MSGGRRSGDSAARPAMKVVGFRVEGVPPSPDQLNALTTSTEGGGSPDPVIIPPSFQEYGSDRSAPVSPRRTNTLPSFLPEGTNKISSLKDIQWTSQSRPTSGSASERSPESKLVSSTSLPHYSNTAQEQLRRQAMMSSDEELSPIKDPLSGHPMQSAFRNRTEQLLSSSYKAPGLHSQPWRRTDISQLSATFTQGARFPENVGQHTAVRPIKMHMRGTNSDGSRIVSPDQQDLGTTRAQHGFQVGQAEPAVASSPFASRTSQTLQHSDLAAVAEDPAREDSLNAKAPPSTQPSAFMSKAGSASVVQEPAKTITPATPQPVPSQELSASTQSRAEAPTQSQHVPETSKDPAEKKPSIKQESKKKEVAKKEPSKEDRRPGGDAQGVEEKKKTTKAERRAIQERQRAEKAAAKEAQEGGKKESAPRKAPPTQQATTPRPGGQSLTPQSSAAPNKTPVQKSKQARRPSYAGQTSEMFAHLPQYRKITTENVFEECSTVSKVHPAILQLGLKIAAGELSGGNARCLAMLNAFKAFIQDYQTPESKEMARDLTSQLNLCIQFLVECRPMSMSMGTAVKNLKLKITQVSPEMEHEEAKDMLLTEIDTFIQEKITYADKSVADLAASKIENRDVVLTFAFSSAVLNTFLKAREAGRRFRIIVVDSRPHYEGRLMLSRLADAGIPCTYLQLNAICFIMKEVTKVFMGASGALSNGTIIARTGSASVAMAAHAMQRPVIVCCETLKFVDRVQLDSITYNELGDPELLAEVQDRPDLSDLKSYKEEPRLEVLNLLYDAMPSKFVSMLVTEMGAIPPTSIPVILREYRTEPRL